MGRAAGAITVPLGERFGLQADFSVSSSPGFTTSGALHLFARNPASYLIGGTLGFVHSPGATVLAAGPEAELYLDRWTISAWAGASLVRPAAPATPRLGPFAITSLSYYPTNNWRVSAGITSLDGYTSAQIGTEYLFDNLSLPLAWTGELRLGQDGAFRLTTGFRGYLGPNPDKTLIDRQRQDDPADLSTALYTAAGKTTIYDTPKVLPQSPTPAPTPPPGPTPSTPDPTPPPQPTPDVTVPDTNSSSSSEPEASSSSQVASEFSSSSSQEASSSSSSEPATSASSSSSEATSSASSSSSSSSQESVASASSSSSEEPSSVSSSSSYGDPSSASSSSMSEETSAASASSSSSSQEGVASASSSSSEQPPSASSSSSSEEPSSASSSVSISSSEEPSSASSSSSSSSEASSSSSASVYVDPIPNPPVPRPGWCSIEAHDLWDGEKCTASNGMVIGPPSSSSSSEQQQTGGSSSSSEEPSSSSSASEVITPSSSSSSSSVEPTSDPSASASSSSSSEEPSSSSSASEVSSSSSSSEPSSSSSSSEAPTDGRPDWCPVEYAWDGLGCVDDTGSPYYPTPSDGSGQTLIDPHADECDAAGGPGSNWNPEEGICHGADGQDYSLADP